MTRTLAGRFRDRLGSLHADHRTIAQGAVYVLVFVLIAKIIGAAKEIAVAYYFGRNASLDAYLFVFNLISWPIAVWWSVSSLVLIPFLAQLRHTPSEEARLLRAESVGATAVVAALAFVTALLCMSALLKSGFSGLPDDVAALGQNMLWPMVGCIPLGLLVGTYSAFLMAEGKYINTLLEATPAAIIIIALLVLATPGISTLVWATLIGTLLQAMLLVFAFRRWTAESLPKLSFRSPHWRKMSLAVVVTLVGQALISVTTVVDQFYAARLQTGDIATLGYANRLLGLVLSLGALTVSRATLPVFSMIRRTERTHLQQLARRWAWLMLVAGLIAAGALMVVAVPLVSLLFERGAFKASDTEIVSRAFLFGLPQVPIYFTSMVIVSVLASRKQHLAIALISGAALCAKVTFNSVLVPVLGLNGLLLATSLMYVVSAGGSWIVFCKDMRGEESTARTA